MRRRTVPGPSTAEGRSVEPQFSDGYGPRDYEIMLDVLYGLFDEEESTRVRVFDPFVHDTREAVLLTPRMLADRIEAMIGTQEDA